MIRFARLPALLSLGLGAVASLHASKLVSVTAVDEQVLLVHLKDSEIVYRDDGQGPSAFTGHDSAPGDDKWVPFGAPVDPEGSSRAEAWTLKGPQGTLLRPQVVHRKAKVQGNTSDWKHYGLEHWFFLRLPEPLQEGATYHVTLPEAAHADAAEVAFTYDLNRVQSEAIHVNLLGYTPKSPIKSADIYLWLGDGGARDYSAFVGRQAWLYDLDKGARQAVGKLRFGRKNGGEAHDRNMTGSDVWHVDFTGFERPGRYRLVVEGIGASAPFEIREDVWRAAFRTSLLGYYYMRIGEPIDARVPAPRQPQFIGEVNPKGLQIYKTDFHPFDPQWQKIGGDTWDEPHFRYAEKSYFWTRRLPGNPTNPSAKGGHSDALDWDRHLGHVGDIYDLLLPFILSGGRLSDDQTGIRESGNGIPDLIDEARNEVDFWLSARDGEAYSHGLTNPTLEKTVMFQAGTSAMAAWANAANCAMIAEAFRLAGKTDLMAFYRDEAVKAYRFAEKQPQPMLNDLQEIGDSWMRGRDFRQMAAAYLFNVTGDTAWEKVFALDSVAELGVEAIEAKERWNQLYATVAYLTTPHRVNHSRLARILRESVRTQALENNVKWMDLRASRRASNNNYWQTAQNLQMVMAAHAFTKKKAERERFEKALVLEADWGLGRNPMNCVEMTGLGSRHFVNIYTSGRNDGAPGLHPGHTPYNNMDPWGPDPGSNPRWFSDRGYPAWEKWPHQEAYFNSRYCWSNGEFTPRQTMRGKMALLAYLEYLSLPASP